MRPITDLERATGREDSGPTSLLLLEEQEDHAELVLETLSSALPGLRVHWAVKQDSMAAPPEIILLSLSTDPRHTRPIVERFTGRGSSTVLILVEGYADRWTESDLAGLRPVARVSKRQGREFLRRLPDVIRLAWCQAHDRLPASRPRIELTDAPSAAPPAPAAVPPVVVAGPPMPAPAPVAIAEPPKEQGNGTRPHYVTPNVEPVVVFPPAGAVKGELADEHCTAQVAGLLAGTLDGLLSNLSPLAELIRCRFPQDGAVARYAASLDQEVTRARAIARRLAAVAGPENSSPARRVESGAFVALRLPAWRLLAPKGIAVENDSTGTTPDVEIVPDVIGRALDDIIASLLAGARTPDRVRIDVTTSIVDDESCRTRAGLRPGRYARITAVLVSAAGQGLRPETPGGRRIERALAAIKAHGGYLELARGVLGGTAQATIFLPGLSSRRSVADERASARPAEILIVDDDAGLRHVAREMLHTVGYVASEAASGEEAVELYRAGARFDLVLLDLTMTGMDGVLTFEALRRIDPRAPVLLVSGSVTSPALETLLAQGLLGFLPKPFGIRQLVAAVNAALGRPAPAA